MISRVSTPVTESFHPDKQGAKRHYGSHPYFTKRAWNVVQQYIRHFSNQGDVVLDPFGGSGVTAVESLVLGRRAIYVDICAWACFLARQTAIAPVDLGKLGDAFKEVEGKSRKGIEEIWRTSDRELAARPVEHWYPKDCPLPPNSDVSRVEDLFTPKMLHGLAMLRAAIMEVRNPQSRDLLRLAFSSTLARINRTFLSTKQREESRGGSAIFSLYRYKVASKPVELPLWEQFANRVDKLTRAKLETNALIGSFYREDDTASFIHGSATRLAPAVQPESVDYIYTDPPYGAHISYLDLSTMWAAWLGLSISEKDRKDEVIEGGQLDKSRDDYQSLLKTSIEQMAAVLKKGSWLSLVFAHRDTSYWDAIVQACQEAGLNYANTVVQPVGVVWSMHKKKNPLRVLSGELVLNFRKMSRVRRIRPDGQSPDGVSLCIQVCAETIARRNGATTEDLHHAVVPRLLEAGLLAAFSKQQGDITPLLKKEFEFDAPAGRWHIRPGSAGLSSLDVRVCVKYFIKRMLTGNGSTKLSPEEVVQTLVGQQVSTELDRGEIQGMIDEASLELASTAQGGQGNLF